MTAWQPIATAPRSDDEVQRPVLILVDRRRFVAEYDPASGHFFAVEAPDGVPPGMEFPGRLHGATHWAPPPAAAGAEFRLHYACSSSAEAEGLPPKGTPVSISGMADLDALMAATGHKVIVHPPGYRPWWVDGDYDDDTGEFIDHVEWYDARWIEVYNGYRE